MAEANAPKTNVPVRVGKLIAVGDSLGDTNNIYDVTSYVGGFSGEEPKFFPEYYKRLRTWTCGNIGLFLKPIPRYPYYEKRFSNGEITSDHVAKLLDLAPSNEEQFLNMAFGGSMLRSVRGSVYDWYLSQGKNMIIF